VGTRLARSKVPRQIVVVDEIPKGPSGKLQRIGIAQRLGLDHADRAAGTHMYVAARDDVEERLTLIVQDVLRLDEPVGVTDDFFDLGADSLHTGELLDEIERAFGRPLSARVLLAAATVERMADALHHPPDDDFVSVMPVQPAGSRPPVFFVMRGGSVIAAKEFVPELGSDQPIFGLRVPAMHGPKHAAGSVEDTPGRCVHALREVQREGPYFVFVHSLGGVVAHDIARQLGDAGQHVGLVTLAASHTRACWLLTRATNGAR
jgi:acyl carrier protein